MADLRKDFEEWLRKQNNSSSTIEQYIRRIDKICRETYQNCNWNNLNGEIFPVFAQYTEYANKEYYLDFVTIRYALNYFKTFSQINNKPSFQKNKKIADIKIFLYHKKSDYFLNTVNFENLYDYLGILNSIREQGSDEFNLEAMIDILYKQPNQQYKLDYSQRKEFENVIASVLDKNTIKPNRKLAIHIVYKKSVSATRTALSKYYLFQQTTQPASGGEVEVSNGEIHADGIVNISGGNITLSGGEFIAEDAGAKMNISGGTINISSHPSQFSGFGVEISDDNPTDGLVETSWGAIEMTGGTINVSGKTGDLFFTPDSPGNYITGTEVNISGGELNINENSGISVIKGYKSVDNDIASLEKGIINLTDAGTIRLII